MEQVAAPVDVFSSILRDGDVVTRFRYRFSEVNEPSGEHPPWLDGFGKEVEFSVEGLQLSKGASPSSAPPGHLHHKLINLLSGYGDTAGDCIDLNP